ncbi:hypothetical protein UlMin_020967 [Ulmus minor]
MAESHWNCLQISCHLCDLLCQKSHVSRSFSALICHFYYISRESKIENKFHQGSKQPFAAVLNHASRSRRPNSREIPFTSLPLPCPSSLPFSLRVPSFLPSSLFPFPVPISFPSRERERETGRETEREVFNMDKYFVHELNSSPKPIQPTETEPLTINVSPQTEPLKEPKIENKVLSFEKIDFGDSLKAVQFNQLACRQKLCEMIVIDELPFNHVEGQGFKSFCAVIQPRFVIPSRMTVKRDVVKLYLSEMVKLKNELTVAGQRVSLTTDCWTSRQQIPYLCLTAHWIDCNWCLKKRILSFVQIPNHKGDSIAKLIESCLQTWGIEKVYTITLDNASANDVAVGILKRRVNGWNGTVLDGDYMHVRCAAHIINLIVESGLKEMHKSICAIRNAVRYIRLSTSRLEKFAMCVLKEKIDFK